MRTAASPATTRGQPGKKRSVSDCRSTRVDEPKPYNFGALFSATVLTQAPPLTCAGSLRATKPAVEAPSGLPIELRPDNNIADMKRLVEVFVKRDVGNRESTGAVCGGL
jgi:hypothetical protein